MKNKKGEKTKRVNNFSTGKETGGDKEEPPSLSLVIEREVYPWQKLPLYKNIPPEVFLDWRWQIKNMIKNPSHLFEAFPYLNSEEKENVKRVHRIYPLLISPYYLSLIDPFDPDDPVKKQAIPVIDELLDYKGERDPP